MPDRAALWLMLVEADEGDWWLVDVYTGMRHSLWATLGSGVRHILETCDQGVSQYAQAPR